MLNIICPNPAHVVVADVLQPNGSIGRVRIEYRTLTEAQAMRDKLDQRDDVLFIRLF